MVGQHVRNVLQNATEKSLMSYKIDSLKMPLDVAEHPYFSLSNVQTWMNMELYEKYLRAMIGQSTVGEGVSAVGAVGTNTPSTAPSPATLSTQRDVIVISDDSDSEPSHAIEKKFESRKRATKLEGVDSDNDRPAKRHASKLKVIEIIDSSEDEEPLPSIKQEPGKSSNDHPKDASGRFIVTRKVKVDAVEHLDSVPSRWPVPTVDTAYILDGKVSKDAETVKGKPKGLDAVIKAEDQDSWGAGTNGSTTQEIKLMLLNGIPARRSVHLCNGGLRCEMFDEKLLEGYKRKDGDDMDKTKQIFQAEQARNEADGETVLAATETFYRLINTMKCKKNTCPGTAVLKLLKNPPSTDGKDHFVGCSDWNKVEEWEHIYAPIPSFVDEAILFQLMNNQPVNSLDVDKYEGACSTFIHPRHGKQKYCKHTHFRHGHSVLGKIIRHKCHAKKIVYTSKDHDNPKVVVILQGQHSHPPWPEEKPTQEAKEDLSRCLKAFGILGATAGRLDDAPTTLAILGSALSAKHDAFRNRKLLHERIREEKDAKLPAGFSWQGIVDQYEQDQKLPTDQRYLWHLRMEGNIKLVVTMNPILAALFHTALYVVGDYTFKRVHGDLDECEFVVWNRATNERVTVARIYCNSSTREVFGYAFEALFTSIEKATGHNIKFKVFDTSGNILAVILDMEAAQVQGLGDAIICLQMNDPTKSGIYDTDPEVLVQFLVKLCTVHFDRRSDNLVEAVGVETVQYLNKFRALTAPSDIATWHRFCREHPSEKLRNWYTHKITYPWLLPGFNKVLSRIPNDFWDQTPNHTNLVETAHAATNRCTQINLLPLEAIQKARSLDASVAASITAASQACILRNTHNSEIARMTRTISRRAHNAHRRANHNAIDKDIDEVRENIATASLANRELKAQLKDLTEKKKEAGRTPRHNRTNPQSNTTVPLIHGSTRMQHVAVLEGDADLSSDNGTSMSIFASHTENSGTPAQVHIQSDLEPHPQHTNLALLPFSVPSNAPPRQDLPMMTASQSTPDVQASDTVYVWDLNTATDDPYLHPGYALPPIDLGLLNAHLDEMYPGPSMY